MNVFLIAAIVIAILIGLGFVLKALFYVALIAAAVWVGALIVRGAQRAL